MIFPLRDQIFAHEPLRRLVGEAEAAALVVRTGTISTVTSGNLRVARLIDQPRYGIDEVAVGMWLLKNGDRLVYSGLSPIDLLARRNHDRYPTL
jgi:hypothetical protein